MVFGLGLGLGVGPGLGFSFCFGHSVLALVHFYIAVPLLGGLGLNLK